ncbi:Abhydrolase domain-containing protein mpaH [Lachnellula suecica]|uniref:Abhydrolase domain-containing protein mpaH n=1 Tax=Lachnellula suecica TaxID=602035 RepID=A0A8T9C3G3_9HELO|nr:Abhydrolase domain-containing protein mpaH [Lachnellula suecica]
MSHFNIINHTSRCQHTRHWRRAVEPGFESSLKLAVKQYVPKSNDEPRAGDVTFVGAIANGFPKEMYEPLWDDLYERMAKAGKRIRGIWIADVAHQGGSGVLNEKGLGNDLADDSKLHQDEMPAPLIGIGSSVGAVHLAHLSLLHPSLLHSLVLIDPTIQISNPRKDFAAFALPSTYRRELWPSRKAAAESFAKSKYYQAWNPRVLDLWIKHGLRELPTEIYPGGKSGNGETPVTLTTTKAQEVLTYIRPAYNTYSPNDKLSFEGMLPDDVLDPTYPFYRPEAAQIFRQLPDVKPHALYIFGSKSPLSPPEGRKAKTEATGSGVLGGGKRAKELLVEGAGHLVAFEKVEAVGEAVVRFVKEELDTWEKEKEEFERRYMSRERIERAQIDEAWKERIGPAPSKERKDVKEKL